MADISGRMQQIHRTTRTELHLSGFLLKGEQETVQWEPASENVIVCFADRVVYVQSGQPGSLLICEFPHGVSQSPSYLALHGQESPPLPKVN